MDLLQTQWLRQEDCSVSILVSLQHPRQIPDKSPNISKAAQPSGFLSGWFSELRALRPRSQTIM